MCQMPFLFRKLVITPGGNGLCQSFPKQLNFISCSLSIQAYDAQQQIEIAKLKKENEFLRRIIRVIH